MGFSHATFAPVCVGMLAQKGNRSVTSATINAVTNIMHSKDILSLMPPTLHRSWADINPVGSKIVGKGGGETIVI